MIDRELLSRAGCSAESLAKFLKTVKDNDVNLHSLLLMRGDELFFERYWAPFTAEMPHRMYSITKSFVSIAIGCLLDEGKISLDDPIVKYFPDKQPDEIHPLMAEQTIRNMLMMSTCLAGANWFTKDVTDRTAFYFAQKPVKPAGTLYYYDSNGSYILGVLAERVSGMPLLDYLKMKVLDRIGGFESAHILKTPDGTPWGDSALICTPRALMNFARFVMNYGAWQGEHLMSEEYLRAATAKQVDNNPEGYLDAIHRGYGYQFWRTERNGFACLGMGGQYAICLPDYDLICVMTADTQISESVMDGILYGALFELVDSLDGAQPQPVDLSILDESLAIGVSRGEVHSDLAEKISGKVYKCDENPMGITSFKLDFNGREGVFTYHNAQGEKALPFGMKENRFGKFPQAGYSDEYGNVHEINDFRYDCAASAGWLDERTLQMRVQIIDRYFGKLTITFAFRNEEVVGIRMIKCAEDFLKEYEGFLAARSAGSTC